MELEDSALGFAMTLVHDREQAEEIVQEAFANIWAARNTPEGRSEFKRWLYKAILNIARDQGRHRQRWSRLRFWTPAPPNPFDEVGRRVDDAPLVDALRVLRPRERAAVHPVKSVRRHEPGEAARAADARDDHGSIGGQVELREGVADRPDRRFRSAP